MTDEAMRGGVNDMLELVLGWSNPETAGGESLRLYALDAGGSPRWDKTLGAGGRTAERALIHASTDGQHCEGDRYLLIRLGDRFVDADTVAASLLAAHTPPSETGTDGVEFVHDDGRRCAWENGKWIIRRPGVSDGGITGHECIFHSPVFDPAPPSSSNADRDAGLSAEDIYRTHGWSGCDGSSWARLSPAAREGWEHAARIERILTARAQPEGMTRVEWAVENNLSGVFNMPTRESAEEASRVWPSVYVAVLTRTVTEFAPVVGEWRSVEEGDDA